MGIEHRVYVSKPYATRVRTIISVPQRPRELVSNVLHDGDARFTCRLGLAAREDGLASRSGELEAHDGVGQQRDSKHLLRT